ncbi:carbon-nitrogen hydrolase family protein [Acidimangrovimonas pyrenivorans]|uniref:Carbon-nitrogen hydrolase family protein n=1 Tax=Acidimangrovimonas pyrenivorans TaxID=2030798 RepID=A0ABV7AKW6_9RHOB
MAAKAAVIQRPPALLNREATIEGALASIDEAAAEGAELLVFPEAFIPGYPTWAWRLRPGGDGALAGEIHARFRANAVDLGQDHLLPIQEAAQRHRITIAMGINELDGAYSGTTIFNTLVIIGPDGSLLNRHRKLMPTNPERMVWGFGDASGLRVVDTPVGRIGGLICWENYLPLARYALYAQKMDILVAPTWDTGESWTATMRHIAKEGGCWVIGTATAMTGADVPADFPERDTLFTPEEWINVGDAVVAKPMGALAAGPQAKSQDILYAEIDAEAARRARRSLDVAGHYSRPDLFSLGVDRRPLPPVTFTD